MIRRIRASSAMLLCGMAIASGCSSSSHRAPVGPIIEPEELADQLNDGGDGRIVILDVRAAADYDQGHVRGAVRVDPEEWKDQSTTPGTGLDHESLWRDWIGGLGVSGREPVVICDGGRMTDAARVWFIFQHFGVPEVGVLNGGYAALEPLIAQGRIPVSRDPTPPRSTTFSPSTGPTKSIGLAEKERVRRAVQEGDAQILDTRTPEEYLGEELRRNLRGGHIPNAINLPHEAFFDERGRIRSAEALSELFREAGFTKGRPVITHCQSGGRGSLAALAAERAGYGPVLNYYLSYGEWAADASCPVQRAAQ